MLGKAITLNGDRYNVVILAGGNGTRMGEQSNYIPKALSQFGERRAIDYIIERYESIAHKFIIGTGKHYDLIEYYVRGRFPSLPIEFSRETSLKNNAVSTLYCLDHADTSHPTLILFCDLLVVSNFVLERDTILVAGKNTTGKVGTFRHTDRFGRGILGHFSFGNTSLLKSIAYYKYYRERLFDLTEDIVMDYNKEIPMRLEECGKVYEFGNNSDLEEVRKLWETEKNEYQ
jgi:GTP:adenosylcobinamide-phosphate guanylyltransferase